jgi:hypothetical protein
MCKMVPASLFSWLPKGFRDGQLAQKFTQKKNIEEENRIGRLRASHL